MTEKRTLRLRTGEILFYQGDAGDDMYLVIEGKIRLINGRWDSGRGDDSERGAGEFLGESAFGKGRRRARTAIALEPTALLVIERHDLDHLARDQPAVAARILHAVNRLENQEHPSPDPPAVTSASGSRGKSELLVSLKGFDPHSRYLFLKEMTCPVCHTHFELETVRHSRLSVEARYPDFRVRYKDIEPLWYRYAVCPTCLFAGRRKDFEAAVDPRQVRLLKEGETRRCAEYGACDFSQARDARLAIASTRLAAAAFARLEKPCLDQAVATLNLMWLLEDCRSEAEARDALRRATDLYVQAYQQDDHLRDPKVEQRIAYLIGWLSNRLHRTQEAIRFVSQAVQFDREGDKAVARMARDLMPSIRRRQHGEQAADMDA